MILYQIEQRAPIAWGCADVVHGITTHLSRVSGRLQLERAGPAIPEFSCPVRSSLLVTAEGRAAMQAGPFKDILFRKVDYANVVDIDWDTWETGEDIPDEFMNIYLPEFIMNGGNHCPELAEIMPKVWEVYTEKTLSVFFPPTPVKGKFLGYSPTSYEGDSLVQAVLGKSLSFRRTIVTEAVKSWFEANSDGWLDFIPVDPYEL